MSYTQLKDFLRKKGLIGSISLAFASVVAEAWLRLMLTALNTRAVSSFSQSVQSILFSGGLALAMFFGGATFVLVYKELKKRLRDE
jgi:hypothetical protein